MAHFTNAEFKSRQQKTIKELERRGLHGLLIFRQESMYYLTGYENVDEAAIWALFLAQCLGWSAMIGGLVFASRTAGSGQAA